MVAMAHWSLKFSDEFTGSALDLSKWKYEVLPPGTFNGELQRYTNNSAELRDGQLVITAKREGDEIVSTRLNSVFNFTYGMVEMRGKVPYGAAIWPAFWMLGTGQWPLTGEVDILEVFGERKGKEACACFHMAAHHWPNSDPLPEECRTLPDMSTNAGEGGWHVWRLFWTPTRLSITLDAADAHDPADARLTCYDKARTDGSVAQWPFFGPQYMLLNLAVGGNGVEMARPSQAWSHSRFFVDYVRVYQLPDGFVDLSTCQALSAIPIGTVGAAVGAAAALPLLLLVIAGCRRTRSRWLRAPADTPLVINSSSDT